MKAETFVSPVTLGRLRDEGHQWVCESSGARFPIVGGVPWLLPDARVSWSEWKHRTQALVAHYERFAQTLKESLKNPALSPSTRSRIEGTRETTLRHVEFLRDVLSPLKPQTKLQGELASAFGYSVPANQGLLGYFPNLVRDWSASHGENEASFAILKAALGTREPGTTLVLGSGGGRLAFDFHDSIQTRGVPTYCADINPILTYSAKRIFEGETLKVCEFPVAPRDLEAAKGAVHACRAPKHASDGLHVLFADAFALPFADGALDTVITPWLVDIVPHRFEAIVREINRVLKVGGAWVNTGSFNFRLDDVSDRISPEEGLESLAQNGFVPEHSSRDKVPYLVSKLDSHERHEWLFSFRAAKKSEAPRERVEFLPEWFMDASKPVQAHPSWQMQFISLESQAFVLSLIDGKRGLGEIAQLLAQRYQLPEQDALDAAAGFLRRLHDDAIFTRTS
ncbi:MAG: PqqD family peptide modification chaperone [Bdellovibrionota bacterium]